MSRPVLFLAFANDLRPDGVYLPSLSREANEVRGQLDRARKAGLCDLVVRTGVSAQEVLSVFGDPEYRNRIALFHYAGHAEDYLLLLQEGVGESAAADARGLAAFLKGQHALQMVFLNACATREQVQYLLDAGISAVIATSQLIEDTLATDFAIQFYTSLANGVSLDRAFDEAKGAIQFKHSDLVAQLQAQPNAELDHFADGLPWALYSLPGAEVALQWNLPQAAGDPLFGLPPLPALDLPDEPYRYLSWYERQQAELFFGRGSDIRKLYDAATAADGSPLILLYGQSGVGKSSLLAAGLTPRLEAAQSVRYVRRTMRGGLVAALKEGITGKNEETERQGELRDWWVEQETNTGKPLTVIVDQVEEVFTQAAAANPNEMSQFVEALQAIFRERTQRPQGKLILGFRKEWQPEIEQLLSGAKLPRTAIFLDRMDRNGIIESVLGPSRSSRLQQRYGLQVDEDVPIVIADDLLEDRDSPVAPTLQTLLSKLWRRAKEGNSTQPRFTLDLYQSLKREGILLGDFLDQQIEEIRRWNAVAVDSGLQLDLLTAHTSERGTSAQHTKEELLKLYAGEHGLNVSDLIEQNCEKRLLVDPAGEQAATTRATRLVHDTLAPLVRERYEKSDKPGQRARRILENRAVDWQGDKTGAALDEADLKAVEAGQAGMRAWTEAEKRLVEASRQARAERQRSRRQLRFAGIAAVTAILLFAILAVWQWQQSSKRGNQIAALATTGAEQAGQVKALATESQDRNTQLQVRATSEAELRQTSDQRLEQALINESKRLATLSLQQLAVDPVASVNLALAALPSSEITRPYVAEAEYALSQAIEQVQEQAALTATLTSAAEQVAIWKDKIAVGGFGGVRIANLDLSDVTWAPGLVITGSAVANPAGQILRQSGDFVSRVRWSAEGELLGTVGNSIYIWQKGQLFAQHSFATDDLILCAEWNPQRAEIAICTGQSVYLWSPNGEEQPHVIIENTFNSNPLASHQIAWSPEGRWLVAIGSGMALWDDAKGEVATQDRYETLRSFYGWSPDSTHFVTNGYLENTVRLWPVSAPAQAVQLGGEESYMSANFVQLSNTVKLLTSVSNAQFLLWDLDGKAAGSITPTLGIALRQGILSPDKTKWMTDLNDGTLQISDAKTGEVEKSLQGHNNSWLDAVAWYPSGSTYVATASGDGVVQVWNLDNESELIGNLLGFPADSLLGNALWIDRQRLLVYGNNGFRLWQVFDEEGKPLCYQFNDLSQCNASHPRLSAPDQIGVRDAHFKGAQSIVYLLSNDAVYNQLNQDGTLKQSFVLPGGGDTLWLTEWSPDGRRLLRFENFGNGEIWQLGLQDWTLLGKLQGFFGPATVWLDAGIVEAPGDGRLFDPNTGQSTDLPVEGTLRWAQQASPTVIFFGDSAGVTLWDASNHKVLKSFHSDLAATSTGGEVSHDQRWLLLNDASGATLWDIASGKEQWRYSVNTLEVGNAALSFDDRWAAIVSSEGVAIWQAKPDGNPTPAPLWSDHNAVYNKVLWSKVDNRFLIQSESDTVIWRWDATTQSATAIDRIPHLMFDVNDDFSSLLVDDQTDMTVRSWRLWQNSDELIAKAKACCLPRPLTGEQRIEFGLGD
ncbi:MAG: AAA family ATPase [Caldilineaceae bacterium]